LGVSWENRRTRRRSVLVDVCANLTVIIYQIEIESILGLNKLRFKFRNFFMNDVEQTVYLKLTQIYGIDFYDREVYSKSQITL
jgi:hypothetical protein